MKQTQYRSDDQNSVGNNHLKIVDEMIQNIQFGSVTIIVQDGKVVQIEKLEKHRIKD